MQIKTTWRSHGNPGTATIIKETNSGEDVGKGDCWWGCEQGQPPWRSCGSFSKLLKIELQ